MEHEGMVHALEEIRRLLKPGGALIDIHPIPQGVIIEVVRGQEILFAGPKRENLSEDVLQAESALNKVVKRGLFVVEEHDEFDFLTYATTIPELLAHWDQASAYEDRPKDDARIAYEEKQLARAEAVLSAAGKAAEIAFHERARITRLHSPGDLSSTTNP